MKRIICCTSSNTPPKCKQSPLEYINLHEILASTVKIRKNCLRVMVQQIQLSLGGTKES